MPWLQKTLARRLRRDQCMILPGRNSRAFARGVLGGQERETAVHQVARLVRRDVDRLDGCVESKAKAMDDALLDGVFILLDGDGDTELFAESVEGCREFIAFGRRTSDDEEVVDVHRHALLLVLKSVHFVLADPDDEHAELLAAGGCAGFAVRDASVTKAERKNSVLHKLAIGQREKELAKGVLQIAERGVAVWVQQSDIVLKLRELHFARLLSDAVVERDVR